MFSLLHVNLVYNIVSGAANKQKPKNDCITKGCESHMPKKREIYRNM